MNNERIITTKYYIMKIKSLLFAILLFSVTLGFAAPFQNIERILTQPDGTVLHCFISGDEFYNRLHDAEGYTIVQAPDGYFVYATTDAEGNIIPTEHIAGISDPKAIGLKPNIVITQKEYQKKRDAMKVTEKRDWNLNHGVYNNLVVFIKFKGDSDMTTSASTIESMLNADGYYDISMNNYFKKATYNQLAMQSYCYPMPEGDKIIAYEDIYPRNYYMPYNATTNPEGYTNQAEREFPLLKRAIEYIADQVPDTLNIDRDNDGMVDNIIFVVKGGVSDWSDLLWPHMWTMGEDAYINGKKVGTFNFQLESASQFTVSTLCHEMSHSLGFPDLYHYVEDMSHLYPVGGWDLMSLNSNPPQHSSAYMKYKYGTWIDEIPVIDSYGTYTIEANSWEGGRRNCFLIPSSQPEQYYMLEYRDKDALFETGLPGKGLLIYRVDKRFDGCVNYNGIDVFDELYIFRPGGKHDYNGELNKAAFSDINERTVFNHTTQAFPFLNKDIIDEEFNICDIALQGNRMTFTYCPINTEIAPKNLIANIEGIRKPVELTWDTVTNAESYNIYRDDVLLASNVVENYYQDAYDNLTAGHHTYYVTSNCAGEESYRSNEEDVIIGGYCEYAFNMKTTGENGWQGGEIQISLDNDTDDTFMTLYSGIDTTMKTIVPTDINMSLSWLSGWDDSKCSFTVHNNDAMIYQSDNLKEGTLKDITTAGTTAVTPRNFTAKVEKSSVCLDWTSYVETESFSIMRDNEIIAENIKGTHYIDKNIPHHGTFRYRVIANNAGHSSEPTEELIVSVMLFEYSDMTLNSEAKDNIVALSWNGPALEEGVIKYSEDDYITNIGSNSNNWGIKVPAINLEIFRETQLSHIEIYDNYEGRYTFSIYSGDEIKSSNLIYSESFNTTASNDFVRFELSEKVDIDVTKDLWITAKAAGGKTAPIPCGEFYHETNSNLIKIGSSWVSATDYDMPYSWLLRAYTTAPQNQEFTYNVYRQNEMIASGLTSNTYNDNIEITEETCYHVEAVYHDITVTKSNDACVGEDYNNKNNINKTVFPNPVDDILYVEASNIKNITITSVKGDIVFNEDVTGNSFNIDVQHLENGVYVVNVTTETETITEKIVVY